MIDRHYSWVARTGNEGGSLLVCGAEAFADWTGGVFDEDWQLDPACDQARAEVVLHPDDDEVEAGLLEFGPERRHTGLVWQMDGAGTAEIAVDADRTSLLVMRSWVGADHDGPRRHVTGSAARDHHTVGEIDLPSGRIAVVWAATPADEVIDLPAALAAGRDTPIKLDLPGLVGIGALLPIRPGRYRIGHGDHQGADGRYAPAGPATGQGDWSCRWLRLVHHTDTE
ncbi:hypothetical protein [Actinoplanes subglobosus]|uniref:Uncharacterized protein n=1 Tax=Actinoplanes subglobosus TaxID=1547892 RepID=A0ABV8IW82_9ACTN